MAIREGWWGPHERQGDVQIVYKTVPEYQPSSASVTIGDTSFYGASRENQQISVRRAALDMNTVLIVVGVAAVGLGFLFWLSRRKKRK